MYCQFLPHNHTHNVARTAITPIIPPIISPALAPALDLGELDTQVGIEDGAIVIVDIDTQVGIEDGATVIVDNVTVIPVKKVAHSENHRSLMLKLYSDNHYQDNNML